ncbi:MAG: hypothetical protein F6K03_14840 [Kamptonema sp. SIO4C4]|nr:hypothetical protein [Kamptonema sp. SIO4C4]
MSTAIPLFARLQPQIDQTVTVKTGEQFVRLEYQGDIRGFQGFLSTLNNLLNQPNVQGEVNLRLTFDFDKAVPPQGNELNLIKTTLLRNPVERLMVTAHFQYE